MGAGEACWKKIAAGLYEAVIGCDRFQIERLTNEDDEGITGILWTCRVNGVPFDAARTLADAKRFCIPCEE